MKLSEHRVEIDLSHAYALTDTFHVAREHLTRGVVSAEHTKVLAQAAVPLGIDPAPEAATRRELYEEEVLTLAREHTPQQLRPLARRVAARLLITHPIDSDEVDTLAVTEQLRTVSLVEYDDGMCDLQAHLPIIVGRAVMDRLRKYSAMVVQQDREQAALHNTAGKNTAGKNTASKNTAGTGGNAV
ncbi:TPA: hypothetical protein ACPXFP_002241, partial [Streptococcus pneumoniae]